MKKAFCMLLLAFVGFGGLNAQNASLKVWQNSQEVDGILHLDQSCRISFQIEDGLETYKDYVYEIGDIQLMAIEGDATKDLGSFRKKELSYRPGLTFSLRSTAIKDLPKHGFLVIKAVHRFNPQNEETKLNIPEQQLTIRFINDQI